jgi:hypothetical protein
VVLFFLGDNDCQFAPSGPTEIPQVLASAEPNIFVRTRSSIASKSIGSPATSMVVRRDHSSSKPATPRKEDIKSIRSPASSRRQRRWTACPLNRCPFFQRGDGNYFGVERSRQVRQVYRIRQNQKIQVAAKFRCAVKYARLPPHEERSRATPLDRRKGSEYRALAQVILQA